MRKQVLLRIESFRSLGFFISPIKSDTIHQPLLHILQEKEIPAKLQQNKLTVVPDQHVVGFVCYALGDSCFFLSSEYRPVAELYKSFSICPML